MYSVHLHDDVATLIKDIAEKERRSVRGQIDYYLRKVLESEGLLTRNKKADATDQSNSSASA